MTKEDIIDILKTGVTARVFCNLQPEKGKQIVYSIIIDRETDNALTVMETDDIELAHDVAKLLFEIAFDAGITILKEVIKKEK